MKSISSDDPGERPADGSAFEVAILGGGLAGLTLGLQLARTLGPSKRILVIDKRGRPAPEVAHTVGESVVEVASYYLREMLQLAEHLDDAQLPKLALRYFLPALGNEDITRRTEFGVFTIPPEYDAQGLLFPTYNIDRGRLENHLAEACLNHGVTLWSETVLEEIVVGAPHAVVFRKLGTAESLMIQVPWLVDATGPARVLARHLDLVVPTGHRTSSAWFRIGGRIEVEDWSERDENLGWRSRIRPGFRWLSTSHLIGLGYWVWLIPLRSGATSIGVVVDPDVHDLGDFNRLDRMLDWLDLHEPELAKHVRAHATEIRDFHVRKNRSQRVRKLVSADRWAITGEAAGFLDPLYSPGSDFIAVCNTLITDVIGSDFEVPAAGSSRRRGLSAQARVASLIFERTFDRYLTLYDAQYPAMGVPQASVVKFAWDTAVYFGFNVFLFRNGCFCNSRFLGSVHAQVLQLDRLQSRVRAVIQDIIGANPSMESCDRFIDQVQLSFVHGLYVRNEHPRADEDEVRDWLRDNLRLLEAVVAAIEGKFGSCAGVGANARELPDCFEHVALEEDMAQLSLDSTMLAGEGRLSETA